MTRLIAFIGATAGGSIGWWLGSQAGVMTAFFLSVIGSAAGGYYAKRLADDYLP